jgi:hypothetical protein
MPLEAGEAAESVFDDFVVDLAVLVGMGLAVMGAGFAAGVCRASAKKARGNKADDPDNKSRDSRFSTQNGLRSIALWRAGRERFVTDEAGRPSVGNNI